jgi:hypothetical protein
MLREVTDSTTLRSPALRVRPLLVAWLLTVGVDFLFNAGLFSGLFEQSREPGLLADPVLFRRIPVAYLGLAIGVTALAWLFDKIDLQGAWQGTLIGGLGGLVIASLGVVGVWTALEMTGLFVAAAVLVQVIEFGVAGAFLGAYRRDPKPKRLTRVALGAALLAAVAGIVIQNILGT